MCCAADLHEVLRRSCDLEEHHAGQRPNPVGPTSGAADRGADGDLQAASERVPGSGESSRDPHVQSRVAGPAGIRAALSLGLAQDHQCRRRRSVRDSDLRPGCVTSL